MSDQDQLARDRQDFWADMVEFNETHTKSKMSVEPGYECLAAVLQEALDQAQHGKGKERHANDKPYDQQPVMEETRNFGPRGLFFQARKKTLEASRLPTKAAKKRELLGAINYLATLIIFFDECSE